MTKKEKKASELAANYVDNGNLKSLIEEWLFKSPISSSQIAISYLSLKDSSKKK